MNLNVNGQDDPGRSAAAGAAQLREGIAALYRSAMSRAPLKDFEEEAARLLKR